MLPRTRRLALARLCHFVARGWNSASGRVAIFLRVSSSGGGLFGRPVILWIRGASYCSEVPVTSRRDASGPRPSRGKPQSLQSDCLPIASEDYLPASSEKAGSSSLFPEERLR